MTPINRRQFIKQSSLLAFPLIFTEARPVATIMSVNGPIAADKMGVTLCHEHVMVDFIGADLVNISRYNREEVFGISLPKLLSAKQAGCKALIECTPAWLGRDVVLLKKLADASGIHLITNTGYYGAAGEKFLPSHVYTETAEQIAHRWIKEWQTGIDATDIKPGFIKIGVDKFPLTATQQKIVKAAAITHLATGLTIGIHTGDGKAAMEELKILKGKGVAPASWIWIHAQNEKRMEFHLKVAREGGWVEFDSVNAESKQQHIDFLTEMKKKRLLDHVLISQDSGWYHVGEKAGGNFKDYNFVFTEFIPFLRKSNFTNKEIDKIFIDNPAKAFSVKNYK